MKKSFGFPILFMIIITAFFTFILAFLNYSTAERIEFNERIDLRQKILYVFDIKTESGNTEEVEMIFNERIEEEKIDDETTIYTMKSDDEVVAYAFPVRGSGLWGSILGYVGVSADYSKIIGLDFISHSETPGLGGRIEEEPYKEQFRGLELNHDNEDYIVYKPASGGNVDAISGATLTSKSVSDFLNKDIKKFIEPRKGE